MNLVIVESPAKKKKITDYLNQIGGGEWNVIASVGHFRDLDPHSLSFDPQTFMPEWKINPEKQGVVDNIIFNAKKADVVYLATDPDREGEAISQHIYDVILHLHKPMVRITFNEITKEAIKKALDNKRDIDKDLVQAQIARRLVDRIVGYPVSGALKKESGVSMSAGRVQSVVARVIVDRENEIQNFKAVQHFSNSAFFIGAWKADLYKQDFIQNDEKYILDRKIVEEIAKSSKFTVSDVDKSKKSVSPPPPFITSSLQMACANAFGFAPEKTMSIAQRLYEGGHITYMRTDTPNISDEAFEKLKIYGKEAGITFIENKRVFKSKADAQEAHEGIRPTHFEFKELNESEHGVTSDEALVYSLIWKRAVSCQMQDAVYDALKVTMLSDVQVSGVTPKFIATGRVLLSPGYLELSDKNFSSLEDEEELSSNIPPLETGNEIACDKCEVIESMTSPKKRFTSASIVQFMEQKGIGRPSTYATLVKGLFDRGYIKEQDFKGSKMPFLVPTDKARVVVKALCDAEFPFMSIDYTKKLEDGLDDIAVGKSSFQPLVKAEYETIMQYIPRLAGKIEFQGEVFICPQCNKSPLVRIKSQQGENKYYWSCKNYKDTECKVFLDDFNGQPAYPSSEHKCFLCGSPMRRRNGQYGIYWACTGTNCKYTAKDKNGKPVKGQKCGSPGCNGFLSEKKSAKGAFFGCSNYPQCKFTCPSEKSKPKIKG